MDLSYSAEDEAFRAEMRAWLEEHLTGEFAELRGLGGPGREHEAHRRAAGLEPAPGRSTAGPAWAGPWSTAAAGCR